MRSLIILVFLSVALSACASVPRDTVPSASAAGIPTATGTPFPSATVATPDWTATAQQGSVNATQNAYSANAQATADERLRIIEAQKKLDAQQVERFNIMATQMYQEISLTQAALISIQVAIPLQALKATDEAKDRQTRLVLDTQRAAKEAQDQANIDMVWLVIGALFVGVVGFAIFYWLTSLGADKHASAYQTRTLADAERDRINKAAEAEAERIKADAAMTFAKARALIRAADANNKVDEPPIIEEHPAHVMEALQFLQMCANVPGVSWSANQIPSAESIPAGRGKSMGGSRWSRLVALLESATPPLVERENGNGTFIAPQWGDIRGAYHAIRHGKVIIPPPVKELPTAHQLSA